MVLDACAYDRYLDSLLRSIDDERAEPRKSPQVTLMLKAVFDGLIVHSYMLKSVPHPDWKTTKPEDFDKRKLRLRQLLLK